MDIKDPENTLLLETDHGPVVIELRPDLAPKHCARIKELVREKFYDGLMFHRVIDGFMAQTGCPSGTGTGGIGTTSRGRIFGRVAFARHLFDGALYDAQFGRQPIFHLLSRFLLARWSIQPSGARC